MNETKVQRCVCLQVDGRNKPIKSLEGIRSMINLWALQNTNGKKTTYVADAETKKVIRIYKGNGGNSIPTILKENEIDEDLYLTENAE